MAVGSCIGIAVSLLAACDPFEKNIDVSIRGGKFLNIASLNIATGVLKINTDLMVLALFIPMVIGLQLARSRKIMLILLSSVGSV